MQHCVVISLVFDSKVKIVNIVSDEKILTSVLKCLPFWYPMFILINSVHVQDSVQLLKISCWL